MKTINDYKKVTSSLQSMLIMHNSNDVPKVGKYLTRFFNTDRKSEKIVGFDGKTIELQNGAKVSYWKDGSLRIGRQKLTNARITMTDCSYTELNF